MTLQKKKGRGGGGREIDYIRQKRERCQMYLCHFLSHFKNTEALTSFLPFNVKENTK